MGEWYYIGHYGQLGPLTRDQITELIEGEVISYETYVWRVGMSEWASAGRVPELGALFKAANQLAPPPPPPGPPTVTMDPRTVNTYGTVYSNYDRSLTVVKSDKSRTVAGILQLIIPGVGRIYLGYSAYGVLQLVFSLCFVGWLWSFIEGIYILAGGIKYDGFGRRLGE